MKHPLILILSFTLGGCLYDSPNQKASPTLAQLQGCWLTDSTGIDSTESFYRTLICFRDSHFYMARQFPHRDLGATFKGIDNAEGYGSVVNFVPWVELRGEMHFLKNPWN